MQCVSNRPLILISTKQIIKIDDWSIHHQIKYPKCVSLPFNALNSIIKVYSRWQLVKFTGLCFEILFKTVKCLRPEYESRFSAASKAGHHWIRSKLYLLINSKMIGNGSNCYFVASGMFIKVSTRKIVSVFLCSG